MLNGSLQGVVFVAQHLFHTSGGRLVVEDPTYDRTLIAMRTFGAEIAGVALTPEGIDTDALERVLDAAAGAQAAVRHPRLPEPVRPHALARAPAPAARPLPRASACW